MTKQAITRKVESHLPIETETIQELRDKIGKLFTGFDARYVLEKADKEAAKMVVGDPFGPATNLYKSMTLFEFDKGVLLVSSIPERFRVFALEFNNNLQREYECKTQSEKSMAEIIALNFVRILSIQDKVNSCLSMSSIADIGVRYLAVISKELDRAERHYLASLQALRMLKMPPLEVSIKTQTAIVGQNQVVQANQNDKPI